MFIFHKQYSYNILILNDQLLNLMYRMFVMFTFKIVNVTDFSDVKPISDSIASARRSVQTVHYSKNFIESSLIVNLVITS